MARIHRRAGAARSGVLATIAALVVALGATLAGAPPVGAAGAAVSKAPEASRTVAVSTPVTTSSGKALTLGVTAELSSQRTVAVSLGTRDGVEKHEWTFRAPAGSISIDDQGRGSVTLKGARTGGLGAVAITFAPAGPKQTQRCGGQVRATQRDVSVSGSVSLDSETPQWGGVTGVADFTGPAAVTWAYAVDCPTKATPCVTERGWSTYTERGPAYATISGTRSGTGAVVDAARFTRLSTPAGAVRSDLLHAGSLTAPTFAFPGAGARVTAYGDQGSVLVRSAAASDLYTTACGGNGVQERTSWAARVSNGAQPFVLPTEVFGNFRIGDGASATIVRNRPR